MQGVIVLKVNCTFTLRGVNLILCVLLLLPFVELLAFLRSEGRKVLCKGPVIFGF